MYGCKQHYHVKTSTRLPGDFLERAPRRSLSWFTLKVLTGKVRARVGWLGGGHLPHQSGAGKRRSIIEVPGAEWGDSPWTQPAVASLSPSFTCWHSSRSDPGSPAPVPHWQSPLKPRHRRFGGTTDTAHRCRYLCSILLEDGGPPLRTWEVGGAVRILPKLRPELNTVLCLPATGETTGRSWWIVQRSDSKAGMTPRTASLCYHAFTL